MPRWNPAVCILNADEIVIMGGLTDTLEEEESCLGDVILFNIQTERVHKRVQNF